MKSTPYAPEKDGVNSVARLKISPNGERDQKTKPNHAEYCDRHASKLGEGALAATSAGITNSVRILREVVKRYQRNRMRGPIITRHHVFKLKQRTTDLHIGAVFRKKRTLFTTAHDT
jgi:hypothetical protein